MDDIHLEEAGLTKVEAKVYVALVQLGSTKAGPLIKRAELHRATVYDVLKRLMEKGLATYVTKQKTRHFSATHPSCLLDIVERQKQEIKRKEQAINIAIGRLGKLAEEPAKENASIFQGRRGLITVLEEVLRCKEYCSFASKGKFEEVLGNYFHQFQMKKRARKIRARILMDDSLKGSAYARSIYGNFRFLPGEYNYPAATFIFAGKVAFFVFANYPTAFTVESKEVAESFRSYFEMLWKRAKPG